MTASALNLGPYRYRPTRQIDETRMSTLWLASEVTRDSTASPGNLVIIKIARMSDTQYSLTNQRAIENEEKWLGKLEHPNIIRLRTVAEREASRRPIYRARSDLPGNPWFLVTDYLPGGDLQSLLNERQRLPATLALDIAEQLADALAYLHARRCVHCDIKPRNILFHERPSGYSLTESTRPIVIDFGIAKNPSDGPQLASGTPRWITPELHDALRVGRKIEVDPSWDTYAAGLVLYTMITGRKPELDRPGSHSWTPITEQDLVDDTTIVDAKQLAEGLNRLVAGTTADIPGERIQASQLAQSVRSLQKHVRKPYTNKGEVRRARRTGKEWWMAGIGGAAAFVLAGLLLFANSGPGTGGGGADENATPIPSTIPATNPAVVVVSTATSTSTRAATATRVKQATSTPVDTPTPTKMATPTSTASPTATHARATPTSTRMIDIVQPSTPTTAETQTSTPLPTGTSTPLPTRTRTPIPSPTSTQAGSTLTPRPSPVDGDIAATLQGPADKFSGSGEIRFSWSPSRPLKTNECFEVSFWQGNPGNWQNGWGIWGANRDSAVTRNFNGEYDDATQWLEDGATYYWGVLLIEDCQAYANRQYSARRLVSDVRSFTFER